MTRIFQRWAAGAAIMAALCTISACSGPIGDTYANAEAIPLSDAWRDWVVVGSLGTGGPFRLVDIQHCELDQPCTFSHRGQSHTYQKFYGYRLVVLRLEDARQQESHVVLRGAQPAANTPG